MYFVNKEEKLRILKSKLKESNTRKTWEGKKKTAGKTGSGLRPHMGVDVSDVKPPEFHTKEYDILERESD
jgi:hypothetical protein